MSLPTQCELARLVKETALAAAATAAASSVPEGPSAMEEEDGPAVEGEGGGNSNGGVGVASATWAQLLPVEHNWHKTVYTLQIIDALLLPAPVGLFISGRGRGWAVGGRARGGGGVVFQGKGCVCDVMRRAVWT